MKYKQAQHPLIAIGMLLCCALCRPAIGQEANPAMWLLMPLATQIAHCSAEGKATQDNLNLAIDGAKRNSRRAIPSSAWEILTAGLSKPPKSQSQTSDTSPACVELIAHLSSQKFSSNFRQYLASQLGTSPAIQCVATQPQKAGRVKNALISAFRRNDFEVTERAINEAAIGLKVDREDMPTLADCEEVAAYLDSNDFDSQFSDAGIYRLLDGRK